MAFLPGSLLKNTTGILSDLTLLMIVGAAAGSTKLIASVFTPLESNTSTWSFE